MKKKYIKPETYLVSMSTEGSFMRECSWAYGKQGDYGRTDQRFKIVGQDYEDKNHSGWVVAGKRGNSLWDDEDE